MLNRTRIAKTSDVFPLYRYLSERYANTALLESLRDPVDAVSGYSIIGVIAREQLYEEKDRYYRKDFTDGSVVCVADWLGILDQWCGPLGLSESPLQTGAIGYIGYEMHRHFEFVPDTDKLRSPMSKICLTRYALIYVLNRKTNVAYWVSDEDLDSQIDSIERAYPSYTPKERSFCTLGDTEKDFEREGYLDAIRKCIHHIEIGDMLQANITMRFHGRYLGDPIVLYEALRKTTPNPFFAYLDFEAPLISTSPESFLHIADHTITGRPIKGTIRTEIDGKDQIDFLEKNAKNCSENVMITDLIRNDIGRVSQIGTVEVPVLCGTKKFNQIYHLETVVRGTLKDGTMLSDVLKTNFPGGSITGAPKVKSMEIIDDLEFAERGPYCGAIGFFGSQGFISTSIGIRIVYFAENQYYLHAGGGIVVRSDPEDEYEELLLKVESLIDTLNTFNILAPLRQQLNGINAELFRLLSRRIEVAKEVSRIKKAHGIPFVQEHRMESIVASAMKQNREEQLGIPEEFIRNLLTVIFEETMKVEREDS